MNFQQCHQQPVVFCLNLPARTDRRANAETELAKLDLPYTFSDGVVKDPADVPPSWINRLWEYQGKGVDESAYVKGALGTKLAHLKAAQAAQSLKAHRVLIFEDDIEIDPVRFTRATRLYEAAFDRRDNWDIIYFGATMTNFGCSVVPEGIYQAKNVVAAHCYMLSQNGIERTLELALESGQEIDLFYRDYFCEKLKTAFVIVPFSVTVNTTLKSDTR